MDASWTNALGAAELMANPFGADHACASASCPVHGHQDLPASVTFEVDGTPAPKGSKRPLGRRRNGSVVLVESAAEALGPWAERVERAARAAGTTFRGPVEVRVEFRLRRPGRPKYDVPAVKPDGDKLDRAVWDALTAGGLIEDDARVVCWSGAKRYALPGEVPGATVTVREYR